MGLGLDPKSIVENQQQDVRMYSFVQLRDRIRRLRANGDINTAAIEVDLWGKLTFPLACLIFGVLGAPLGVRPSRSGKAMGFGIAVSIIFVYWVLYRWLYVVGSEGHIPPILAAFTPCLLGLLAAAWLVRRTRQ
jgi:lipopolysaccharide export system permease protein